MTNSKPILCLTLAISLACAAFDLGLAGCGIKVGDNLPDDKIAIEANNGEDPYAEEQESTEQMKNDGIVNAQTDATPLVEKYGDDVALLVSPLDGSQGFDINGDKQFVAGSEIKLLIAAEFARQVDEKVISLQDTYKWNKEDMLDGVMATEPKDTSYTYDSLLLHLTKYNDDTAANVLIDILGLDNINAEAQALGLTRTVIAHKMREENPVSENYTCANDLSTLLHGFADSTIASTNLCMRVIENIRNQTDAKGCGAGLPKIYYGHIPSFDSDASNDAGIVYARYPYVVVVLSTLPEKEAKSLMKEITSTVNDDMKGYLRPLQ